MPNVLELDATIQLGPPSCEPTEESVNQMLGQLEVLGVPLSDLAFTGYELIPEDPSEIDRHKLSDMSAESGGDRNYLNKREVEVQAFLNELEATYPDPDARLKKLRRLGTRFQSEGDHAKVDKVRARIQEVLATRAEVLVKRRELEDAFERRIAEIPDLPVYYAGDVRSLTSSWTEDNPLAYIGGHGFYDGAVGFLSCYSLSRLTAGGAVVQRLEEVTDRDDDQLMIFADYRIMQAGHLAVVHCELVIPEN